MELLDKYSEELKSDITLDVTNVRDIQMKLPIIKHKWASRLVNTKLDIFKRQKLCLKAKEELHKKFKDKVELSNYAICNEIDKNEVIAKIHDEIESLKYVVEYLEKVEKILSSTTYDIKNLVELLKLEQL